VYEISVADPGLGIRDPRSGSRDGEKSGSRIRDKHSGSATLLKKILSKKIRTLAFPSHDFHAFKGIKSEKYYFKQISRCCAKREVYVSDKMLPKMCGSYLPFPLNTYSVHPILGT